MTQKPTLRAGLGMRERWAKQRKCCIIDEPQGMKGPPVLECYQFYITHMTPYPLVSRLSLRLRPSGMSVKLSL